MTVQIICYHEASFKSRTIFFLCTYFIHFLFFVIREKFCFLAQKHKRVLEENESKNKRPTLLKVSTWLEKTQNRVNYVLMCRLVNIERAFWVLRKVRFPCCLHFLENSLNFCFLSSGKLEAIWSESENWALNAWSINKDTTKINNLQSEVQKYKVEESSLSHLISCAWTKRIFSISRDNALKWTQNICACETWILSKDRFRGRLNNVRLHARNSHLQVFRFFLLQLYPLCELPL